MIRRNFTGMPAAVLLGVIFSPVNADQLDAYPPAAPGQQRYVIHLEAQPDESLHQLELLVGKPMTVDCNRQQFFGAIERETIVGWGYSYFTVSDLRGPAGTLMACPEGVRKEAFVSLGGGPHWVRYNSKLPVVVYVPQGFEVRYRLWATAASAHAAAIE